MAGHTLAVAARGSDRDERGRARRTLLIMAGHTVVVAAGQPPAGPGRRSRQGGSGTVLSAAVILLVAVVAAALLVIAGYLAVAHRARTAADLAALSGAAARVAGGDACQAAARAAAGNGSRLVSCRIGGDSLDFVVSVTVRVAVPLRPAQLLPDGVVATAHAGRLGLS